MKLVPSLAALLLTSGSLAAMANDTFFLNSLGSGTYQVDGNRCFPEGPTPFPECFSVQPVTWVGIMNITTTDRSNGVYSGAGITSFSLTSNFSSFITNVLLAGVLPLGPGLPAFASVTLTDG